MDNNQTNQTNQPDAGYNGPQKICKHCKKAIPEVVSTCPYCHKKQGMSKKNIIIIVVVVVVLAAVIGNLNAGKTDTDKDTPIQTGTQTDAQNTDATPEKQPEESAEQPTPEVTADFVFDDVNDLIQEYKDNEVAAEQKYKDKTVTVTGLVKDIGNDIIDSTYITINDGTDITWDYAQCYFKNQAEIDKVAALQKGQTVTVTGKVGNYSLTLTLKKCTIDNVD